jgi:hypothetical protein
MHPFQNMSQESDHIWSHQQPNQNTIGSPVLKNESNPTLNDNEACCLAIVIALPNVDSHISMLLLFILVPGQGTVCVPLEHRYGAWENKDKLQNNDQNNNDRGDNDFLDGGHEDNNTTDKSRP